MRTKTTTEVRIEEIMEQVKEAILKIQIEDMADGANDYAYVRVATDGTVYAGREVSWCVGEDEYYNRVPHPLTVWTARGMRPAVGPADGVFSWEEKEDGRFVGAFQGDGVSYDCVADLDEEELAERLARGWKRFDLDATESGLVNGLDLDATTENEIRDGIEAWTEAGNLSAERHPAGCSCGSPECPEWQAVQQGL